MPLSITGVPLHTRSLTVVAALRDDRRWDVRGDVIDLRKSGFVPMPQDIQPPGIIHHMTIRQIVDPETMRIDALEVEQPHVAIEPSERTGGECCRDPAPRLQALRGEVVDEAFGARLSREFGGALGCSHLLTLFFGMAAALPRAVANEREVARRHRGQRRAGERLFWRSIVVDGYEIESCAIELSIHLSDVHSRPYEAVQTPLERLDRQEEVRAVARVEPPTFEVNRLRAAERLRSPPGLADAEWHELGEEEIEPLLGGPIVPGFSRRVRDLLGGREDRALVRDALLQLAPGRIQVLAAVTDRWFARADPTPRMPGAEGGTGPPTGAMGGMADSCYMWREGSPLLAERERATAGWRTALDEE